ncbi:MAG: DUF2442 domain-containing protein [Gemmatimonadaceae bacterium]
MTTSASGTQPPFAKSVLIFESMLHVVLTDGRTISVPLERYSRLNHGSAAERNNFRLIGRGQGSHWPDLDKDLSVEGPLRGGKSDESERSFQRWLAARNSTK